MIGLSAALGLSLMNAPVNDAANLAQAMAKVPQAAKDSLNQFGEVNLAKMVSANPYKNLMISPWSLQECFGMLRLGAKGDTNRELSNFLKQSSTPVEAAQGLQQVRGAIAPLIATDQIRQANGIWLHKGFGIEAQFVKDAHTYFGATATETTFPSPALGQINSFVSKNTRGKIPKLFDDLSAATELVLVNAVSFLDKWAVPFKKENTKNLPFHSGGDGTKDVPTMTGTGKYWYGSNDACQWVNMPYKSGLSMLIVLPKKGVSLNSVLGQPNLLAQLYNNLGEMPGSVFIPRWKSEFTWNLKQWMMKQGVTTCFNASKANFKGLAKTPLEIDQAIQKTYIRVYEEGTEAAAATGIAMTRAVMRPNPPFEFRADHPFAYIIGSPNGVTLFAGVVNNPV